jgi:hypothetical protein
MPGTHVAFADFVFRSNRYLTEGVCPKLAGNAQGHRRYSVIVIRHRRTYAMKTMRFLSCLGALILAACSTGGPAVWFERDAAMAGRRTVEMRPLVDQRAERNDDIPAEITRDITSALKTHGFALVEDHSQGQVTVLACKLGAYEKGNALARWVAPGAGKTSCLVKCEVSDRETAKTLGQITANREVAAGGLYTIGYEKRILTEVAEDIASALDNATRVSRGGTAK